MAEFPTIKEQVELLPSTFHPPNLPPLPLHLQVLPKSKSISKLVSSLALPYLMYLARTQPDIATQAMVGAPPDTAQRLLQKYDFTSFGVT